MRSTIIALNRTIRRWNNRLEETLNLKLEPHLLLGFATIVILLIQLTLYFMLSSQTIYCQIPNLRSLYSAKQIRSYEELPTIYAITPTYTRYVQKAELTRLSHTFMLVPNLHWIIVEDSTWNTDVVSKFIRRLKNEFDFHSITQLHASTPENFKLKPGEPSWKHPKGVWQRNRALEWIKENAPNLDSNGVVYFADDDNTYDLELFNEMRNTKKVSVWPVGFVGGLLVERPIVQKSTNRIQSFNSMWGSQRPFPLDMAGFSVSLRLLLSHPNVSFSFQEKIGYIESNFLGQIINSWEDLEPRANNCSKILVWHTQTKVPLLHEERKLAKPSHHGIDW